ncbi:FmdB family zinc ribbon protein, partial [Chloroflexota bacterium]
MPIYEYVCPGCDTKFELLRPFSKSDEEASCPKCQQPSKRVLSTFACFSTDSSGVSSSIGGSSCDSCSSSSC